MLKITLSVIYTLLIFFSFRLDRKSTGFKINNENVRGTSAVADYPEDLIVTRFSGPELTPSPACIAAAATGEVFVGVDMIGSLGRTPGRGSIIKLIDADNDGRPETHSIFAVVDNPRGILAVGDKVYVLHTSFSEQTRMATGMDLVVFEDKDQNGIADGPSKPLIQNISSPKILQNRGTDHATNGIRMGIDGWIYIAVGDFGFHNAVDRSGTKLSMQGGGIVRVRPDGTEMEIYTHGLRNIYDVAIDPYMNIFTRDNTNDGGGWNIRFTHQIQSGEYGYPLLFLNFTDEIIPALADLGGGSGTGALFMDDPTWPEKYNHVPMMADWGRNQLYLHRVSADGASFKQTEESFIKLSQITDLDIDGSGRVYLSAWDGASYNGSPSKGFVVRAVPKNWKYQAFPNLKKSSVNKLASLLNSGSAVTRLHAQQELLARPTKQTTKAAWKIAVNKSLPLSTRVAGMYTYAQSAGETGIQNLLTLTSDNAMREFALRALSDRKNIAKNVPVQPFLQGLNNDSDRVRAAAIIGLGRLGRPDVAGALLQVKVPTSFVAPVKDTEGPHAVPNSALIPAHLAMRALVQINAADECLKAVLGDNATLALWALRYMHQPKVAQGLISSYKIVNNPELKKQILNTLARLYQKETDYDGSTWWNTRPDSHGPYYNPVPWESSGIIKELLIDEWKKSDAKGKEFFTDVNERYRMQISEFGVQTALAAKEEYSIDLDKIKNKKGQIGQTSIEDIMLAIGQIKGDANTGKALFTKQGCVACHNTAKGGILKGPFMGQIGSIMTREQIAESVLKPNASISQGFASFLITTKGGKSYMGFITEETAGKIVVRNIAGQVFTVKATDIITRKELETSMMPAGLTNSLSYEEFASLVTYLSQQK